MSFVIVVLPKQGSVFSRSPLLSSNYAAGLPSVEEAKTEAAEGNAIVAELQPEPSATRETT